MEIPDFIEEIIQEKVRRAVARKEISMNASYIVRYLNCRGGCCVDLMKRIDSVRDGLVMERLLETAFESDSFDSFRRNALFV